MPSPHYKTPLDVDIDKFVDAARQQVGDRYQFGAHADESDPDPTAWDSSELVEWAARQIGLRDLPDGSWNQYRHLAERQGAVPVEEALSTKGALVFGFSSDPLATGDRPARAYVGISLGDGRTVIDVSERAGEVRELDHGGFYTHGALIPDLHGTPEPPTVADGDPHDVDPLGIPGGAGWMPPSGPTPSDQGTTPDPAAGVTHGPEVSVGPDGRILHQNFPDPADDVCRAPEPEPEPEPAVCYPPEPEPVDQVSYPDDADAAPYSDF